MIEDINKSFYSKLTSDDTENGLNDTLGATDSDAKIYNIVAPQASVLPYLTFGLLTDIPDGIFGDLHKLEDITFYINVFSNTSPANCFQIADLVKALMDDCSLTGITGYDSLYCKREFVGNLIYGMDTGVYQIPLRYRILITKS